MHSAGSRLPPRKVTAALARIAYHGNHVRITDRNLAGFDCLVSTRRGLFAVARAGAVKRVAYGFFFGIRRHADSLFLFESCDRPIASSRLGRVLRIGLSADSLGEIAILIKGLDNQCHQLAIFDERIHLVDTANQAILRFTLDGRPIDQIAPFPRSAKADETYLHLNSIARIDGGIALMLHNGAEGPARPSELARFDREWRLLRRETLAGHGCHDVVEDEAGTLWHCGSMAGELINSTGLRHKVSDRMTRGLSITPTDVVVGISSFGNRATRDDLDGAILFLDRALEQVAHVPVPAAPTDLILL